MKWEDVEKETESSGVYVKLSGDGDRAVGAFCGEPHVRHVVWNGQSYDAYDEALHVGVKANVRVMLNFYSEGKMRVIEMNAPTFKDVCKVREKYGLHRWTFEIQRQGAKGDAKTKYTILPEAQITPEMAEEIASAKLIDLEALAKQGAERE